MIIPTENPVTAQPFFFRKRAEKIDWRRLAAVDVNRVANQMDIDTLQDILTSVAFCDINTELDNRYIDPNFIKLFQLAQLLVEYLLYSQDYLTNNINTLKNENDGLRKTIQHLEQQIAEKANRLTAVRRECHRRRLLLLAQQQLMDSGPQSYHRCTYCPKAFLNASFLAAHIHRRHPEAEAVKQSTARVKQDMLMKEVHGQPANTQNNNTATALEQDVRELLLHLKSSPTLFELHHSSPKRQKKDRDVEAFSEISHSAEDVRLARSKRSPVKEREVEEKLRAIFEEQHKRDMELLKMTFERELHEIQRQHENTKAELTALKAHQETHVKQMQDERPKVSPQKERRIVTHGLAASPVSPGHVIGGFDKGTPRDERTSLKSVDEEVSPEHSAEVVFRQNVPGRDGDHDDKELEFRTKRFEEAQKSSRTPSPGAVQDGSASVIRYSRLLEQLKADPETLRGLRHEVEQLLDEQLAERGIPVTQTRLTNDQLNEKLAIQRRDRELLSKKHPNFMEIREALAQQVDRLAHASLANKQILKPTPSTQLHHGQAGTLPRTTQRTNLRSPVGQSMPALSSTRVSSRSPSAASSIRSVERIEATKPIMQRSSPQLYHKSPSRNTPSQTPIRTANDTRASSRYSLNEVTDKTGLSPARYAQKPPPSPDVQFSHNQRVVTFNRPAEEELSTEEWDSETEDLGAAKQGLSKPVTEIAHPIPDDLDSQLDEADKFMNTGPSSQQTNTNAAIGRPHSRMDKPPSVRTDDEDICSVSSINNEDLSFPIERLGKSSVDPAVASARAHSATLGPRPATRFGSTGRPNSSLVVSVSPDRISSAGTSRWTGIHGSNVDTTPKSDLALEDFESDN